MVGCPLHGGTCGAALTTLGNRLSLESDEVNPAERDWFRIPVRFEFLSLLLLMTP